MGYYSTMTGCYFESPLSDEEMQNAWKEYKQLKNDSDLDQYDIQIDTKAKKTEFNNFDVIPEGEEYYAKHYGNDMLAEFISQVIAPGESTELLFDGDDNESWGYYIKRNKCIKITKEWDYPIEVLEDAIVLDMKKKIDQLITERSI